MNTMFEKKLNINFPKRTFLHKLHISLTIFFMFNFLFSAIAGNKFTMVTNAFCIIAWAINWRISSQKYKKSIEDYKEKTLKEKHEFDMKNAFNFGYYQNK